MTEQRFIFGAPKESNHNELEQGTFKMRQEQFFIANEIKRKETKRQKAILFSVDVEETYMLLGSLYSPSVSKVNTWLLCKINTLLLENRSLQQE